MNDAVNSGDSSDPKNYVSFDSYIRGAPKVLKHDTLVENWNRAHPNDQVERYGNDIVVDPEPIPEAFNDDGSGTTRFFAALQLVGGGIELVIAGGALLAPEPTGATKVVGTVLLLHSIDTLQAATRTILSGNRTATFTQKGATLAATEAGASPPTAETIGVVTDIVVGAGGSYGVGALSRAAPAAGGQLVHLTSARGAQGIRASQTLGLGKSTVYAGPESLAQAKGWSIVARTGIRARDASEVILLPSEANKAFLVVRPLGPFSYWQKVNGTVFSAGAGSFNLTTGAFTRTGAATNQLVIYGLDAGMVSVMRVPASANASMGTVPR